MVGKPAILAARPDLAATWDAVADSFPIRMTRSWLARSGFRGPLARQVLPDPSELQTDGLDDPVGEKERSPVPWVVHKYPDRVLLLLTKRCHLYCRYCFRRTHAPGGEDPTPEEWQAALAYVREAAPDEVILSGGDPLSVPDARLFATLDSLDVPVVRIHTRAPVTWPQRVTPQLVQGLAERGPVWVVVHVNHPDEFAADVDVALQRLVDGGVPVLNQSVLLRDVNDDVAVLAELSRQLVRRRVFPYYLHHPDAVEGNAHFRISKEEGLRIYDGLRREVSGIALPRYVVDPPDGSGKVDVARTV